MFCVAVRNTLRCLRKSPCIHVPQFIWVEVCIRRNVVIELLANKVQTGTGERRQLRQLVIFCWCNCNNRGTFSARHVTENEEYIKCWKGNLLGEGKSFVRRWKGRLSCGIWTVSFGWWVRVSLYWCMYYIPYNNSLSIYNILPEDEPSGSKHVEDIIN
jgi:hypothetical protein